MKYFLTPYSYKPVRYCGKTWYTKYQIVYDEIKEIRIISDLEEVQEIVELLNQAYNNGFNDGTSIVNKNENTKNTTKN